MIQENSQISVDEHFNSLATEQSRDETSVLDECIERDELDMVAPQTEPACRDSSVSPKRSINFATLLCCITEGHVLTNFEQKDHLPCQVCKGAHDAVCNSCDGSRSTLGRQTIEKGVEELLSSDPSSPQSDPKDSDSHVLTASHSVSFEDRYRAVLDKKLSTLSRDASDDSDEENIAERDSLTRVDSACAQPPDQRKRGILASPKFRSSRLKRLSQRMTLATLNNLSDQHLHVKKAVSLDEHMKRKCYEFGFAGGILFEQKQTRAAPSPKAAVMYQDPFSLTNPMSFSQALRRSLNCECVSVENEVDDDDVLSAGVHSLFENDDDLTYDSDPEFSLARKESENSITVRKKGNLNRENDCCSVHSSGTDDAHEDKRDNDNVFSAVDVHNDASVSKMMKEMTHDSLALIWHPPKEGAKHPAPICVKAWIELGCRLRGRIVHPKLVWRSAYHQASVGSSLKGRNVLSSPDCLGSMELLDISRILTDHKIDREQFPLAMQNRSFMIVTSNKERLLFEVADLAVRERVVSGLKLVVARLASMIIVGDKTIFDDFFHPTPFGEHQKQNWVVQKVTT